MKTNGNVILDQLGNEIPPGWTIISDHQETSITLVRHEKWEFFGQRGLLELTLNVHPSQNNLMTFGIRSHGCKVELNKHANFDYIQKVSGIREQVLLLFRLIETSALCFGYKLSEEHDEVITLLPHISGKFIADPDDPVEEKISFSTECELFSASGTCCKKCAHLRKMDMQRRERKRKTATHPMCNKRFLSNEESQAQRTVEMQKRINAEKREMYWKNKYAEQAIDMEEDDHNDIRPMMDLVERKDIPLDMTCLWDNQLQVLKRKGKTGLRWHPK
jgi:hypothetical protein